MSASRYVCVGLCVALFLTVAVVTRAEEGKKSDAATPTTAPAGVTGTWQWSIPGRDGDEREVSVTLKQDGDKLTGTFTDWRGDETEIEDGAIKDGVVTFNVVREWNDNKMITKYSAKLVGDSLQGTALSIRPGREFEAKRSDAQPATKPADAPAEKQ